MFIGVYIHKGLGLLYVGAWVKTLSDIIISKAILILVRKCH
jgi:hypothetical protein